MKKMRASLAENSGLKLVMNRKLSVILHAVVLWALCGATIGLGRALVGIETTLIIHAFAAPLLAVLISLHYFRRFPGASALGTAAVFLAVVMALDGGLVAPVFETSYAMFRSFLGTWLPFGLIFLATFFTGAGSRKRRA
jgi:hypothetical protein